MLQAQAPTTSAPAGTNNTTPNNNPQTPAEPIVPPGGIESTPIQETPAQPRIPLTPGRPSPGTVPSQSPGEGIPLTNSYQPRLLSLLPTQSFVLQALKRYHNKKRLVKFKFPSLLAHLLPGPFQVPQRYQHQHQHQYHQLPNQSQRQNLPRRHQHQRQQNREYWWQKWR